MPIGTERWRPSCERKAGVLMRCLELTLAAGSPHAFAMPPSHSQANYKSSLSFFPEPKNLRINRERCGGRSLVCNLPSCDLLLFSCSLLLKSAAQSSFNPGKPCCACLWIKQTNQPTNTTKQQWHPNTDRIFWFLFRMGFKHGRWESFKSCWKSPKELGLFSKLQLTVENTIHYSFQSDILKDFSYYHVLKGKSY